MSALLEKKGLKRLACTFLTKPEYLLLNTLADIEGVSSVEYLHDVLMDHFEALEIDMNAQRAGMFEQ